MTQEDKELLLTDLCERLPYGVKVTIEYSKGKYTHIYDLKIIDNDTTSELRQRVTVWNYGFYSSVISYPFTDCRPYLRPMSSMTKEEEKVYKTMSIWGFVRESKEGKSDICPTIEGYRWLNVNHFDYNYLIERGLALEAPEGMYKIENI